jgi:isoquinoline 1-oxidoreductase subunit beta
MTRQKDTSSSGMTRRRFFAETAGLVFALTLAPVPRLIAKADGTGFLPDAWLTIAPDNAITIMSPAAEMGNGSFTTLAVIIAEELDADWSRVNVVLSPMDAKKFGNPFNDGALAFHTSGTVRGYYKPLRIVGAQMRRVLLEAAAKKWGVARSSLQTEPSMVVHKTAGKRMTYGEAATFASLPKAFPEIAENELKPIKGFRLIGTAVPRVEVPLKVRGAAIYAMDVQVPGMLYGAVLQSPYEGGAPTAVDDVKARALPGVTQVVKLPEGVGVIGTSVEATQAAKELLQVTWSDAPGAAFDSERGLDEFAAVARDKSQRGVDWFAAGDVETAIKTAPTIITGDFYTRYVYHAQMEPLSATARVAPDGKSAEIWTGTQSPSYEISAAAGILGTTEDRITLHQHWIGGTYGRRNFPDVGLDAVRLSKIVGKTVKVIWSREDDVRAGKFRPMTAHHIEAGLDSSGAIIAWHHRVIGESVMAGRQDEILMKGTVLEHYGIPHRRVEFVRQVSRARVASLRGVGVGPNVFASESLMDDIAHSLDKDPLEFRLAMTRKASLSATRCLERVAELADWETKRKTTAMGIALAEKDETLMAGIAEIALDRGRGLIKVVNFWVVMDCGLSVQPRHLIAEVEGSIIYGLGHVLREEITIKDGHVQQSNFTDYEPLRMEETPEITVEVLSSDNPPIGGGEGVGPVTAASVGNAFLALTGLRIRDLPMSPTRVKTALQGRSLSPPRRHPQESSPP